MPITNPFPTFTVKAVASRACFCQKFCQSKKTGQDRAGRAVYQMYDSPPGKGDFYEFFCCWFKPKIDPSRRAHLRGDGTPDDNDRVEIGPTGLAFAEWQEAGLALPDLPSLREYRLSRLQDQIKAHDCAGLLLFDPLNIRYATDSTNMQLWTTHNAARACFVPPSGKMVLFDFHSCAHLSAHLPLVGEVRGGASFFYFETGDRTDEHAAAFADQILELMAEHAGQNNRLAVDKIENAGYAALASKGVHLLDGQVLSEHARSIKNENELKAMRCAIYACEQAIDEMRAVVAPGVTENDVWAALHAGNIRRGGEWIETRILSSGPRTNPWFQECGRVLCRLAICWLLIQIWFPPMAIAAIFPGPGLLAIHSLLTSRKACIKPPMNMW